ncbi:tRNA-dihydrouridine(47) synthase [NAD(P)(+)]-like, partial [Trichinella pseudospiralis]
LKNNLKNKTLCILLSSSYVVSEIEAFEVRAMDSSGVAPVKAEYLVAKKEKDGDNAQENFQGKRKGVNKKRQFYTVDDKKQLCTYILENVECKFGENCRYSHDKASYWEKKPPDISDNCPLFEELGFCKFGLNCRFAKGHTNLESLENIVKDSSGEVIKEWRFDETNQISKKEKKEMANLASRLSSEYRNVRFESDVDKERCGKKIDWSGKLCLAPLTTLGNLPFRRLCVEFGAEVTCSEMALSTSLFQGLQSEWARLARHESEKCFGIQICVNKPAQAWTVTKIIKKYAEFDFLDINAACPLDDICRVGGGANLLVHPKKLKEVVQSAKAALGDVPLTLKLRTGITKDSNVVHQFLPEVYSWGVDAVVLHGRSRNQRYINKSDWYYIEQCASVSPVPLYGIGDVLSYEDYYQHLNCGKVQGVAVARAALIKPWIFTEIIQQRHWDIRSSERLEILKKFVKYGLLHWGSDSTGVNCTRRFLLEWLSFLCRYIPVDLLEYLPQKMNDRPPAYFGRDDLETLMASRRVSDWIKISEMLLGPVNDGYFFQPKHKANAY